MSITQGLRQPFLDFVTFRFQGVDPVGYGSHRRPGYYALRDSVDHALDLAFYLGDTTIKATTLGIRALCEAPAFLIVGADIFGEAFLIGEEITKTFDNHGLNSLAAYVTVVFAGASLAESGADDASALFLLTLAWLPNPNTVV